MPRIGILCPTRGRPEGFARMVESAKLASQPIAIYAAVDRDDETLPKYDFSGVDVTIFEERKGVPAIIDVLLKKTDNEYIVFAADDAVFRTQNWDTKIIAEFATMDDMAVLFFDNGNGRVIPEHIATSRKWIKLVEPFIYPGFEHFFADLVIFAVAIECGRLKHVPEVLIEHMHPKYGKGEYDALYKSKRECGLHGRDKQRFENAKPRIVEIIKRTRVALCYGA